MNIDGKISNRKAMEIRVSLNDLAGVVSADVAALEAKAYAYAGDKLSAESAVQRIGEVGMTASLIKEEYVGDY